MGVVPFSVKRMCLRAFFCICAVGLAGLKPVEAQDRLEPFESVRIQLALVDQVNRNTLDEHWERGPGAEITLSAPFYAGEIRLGGQLASNRGRVEAVPDYSSQHLFLGWGAGLPLPAGLRLEGGVRAGLVRMGFEHDDTSPAQLVEREIRLDVVGGLHYLLGAWRLEAAAGYGTLFLSEPQRMATVSFGVSRTFGLPAWVRRVLS